MESGKFAKIMGIILAILLILGLWRTYARIVTLSVTLWGITGDDNPEENILPI